MNNFVNILHYHDTPLPKIKQNHIYYTNQMGQKSSKIKITETDKAVLQLKRSKDEIHKFTKRTDILITSEKNQIKQLIKEHPHDYKKNNRIRLLLKRVHYQEYLLQQASDQLINLENMLANIEFKLIESQFLSGLKKGNDILTKLNKEFNNIDQVMDDVAEQVAYQDEINDVLANSIAGVENFEDEIDKELDKLEFEINPITKLELPTTNDLPTLKKKETESIKQNNKVTHQEGTKERIAIPS